MNYGNIKNNVLRLLNQYTIAGTPVANSYNNQQDYINRIPSLVNDAIMEIATTFRKIPAYLNLRDLPSKELENEVRYELPKNLYQFMSGSVVRTTSGKILHTNMYKTQGVRYLIIPKEEDGEYGIEYYRYPMLLAENPEDTDEVDNEEETHRAIPYYVASVLLMEDDPNRSALYNNKFDDLLMKMGPGITAEVQAVHDSYGFWEGEV